MGGNTGKMTARKTMLAAHKGSDNAFAVTLKQVALLAGPMNSPPLEEGQIEAARKLEALGLGRTMQINGRGHVYFERCKDIVLNPAALSAARALAASAPLPGWPGNTVRREQATRTLIAAALRAAYDGVSDSADIKAAQRIALRGAASDFYTAWGDEVLPWERG